MSTLSESPNDGRGPSWRLLGLLGTSNRRDGKGDGGGTQRRVLRLPVGGDTSDHEHVAPFRTAHRPVVANAGGGVVEKRLTASATEARPQDGRNCGFGDWEPIGF